ISTGIGCSPRRAVSVRMITGAIWPICWNSGARHRKRNEGMTGFAYPNLFGKKVPAPAARWAGNAKFNFIGGHNDRTLIPIEELIEATQTVLRREGQDLALYGLGLGPQGYPGLRRFVADQVKRWRGIDAGPDDVLITQGSGQAIDLVNAVLLEAGDTVLLEEFTHQGYLNNLRRLGVTMA